MVGTVHHMVNQMTKKWTTKRIRKIKASIKAVQYPIQNNSERENRETKKQEIIKKRYKNFPKWKMWISSLERGPPSI